MYKPRKIPIRVLFLTALLYACSSKKIINSRAELLNYIDQPDNGLTVVHKIGVVTATMSYKPFQLMTKDKQGRGSSENLASTSRLNDKMFFVLSLAAGNKELLRQLPSTEYTKMIQVLAFRLKDYVSVVFDLDGKPVEALDCIFQQSYGMGTSNQVLLVFDKTKFARANQLDIKIKEFGINIGNLDFPFKIKDINALEDIAVN